MNKDNRLGLESVRLFTLPSQGIRPWAQQVSELLGVPISKTTIQRFPLNQFEVQLTGREGESLQRETVIILGSTDGDTNLSYAEIEQMIDAARRAGATEIVWGGPYCGYARSDKKDKPRIGITMKVKANILERLGVCRIITVNIHNTAIQGFFDIPVDLLDITPLIILALERLCSRDQVFTFTSPDLKGGELVDPMIEHFPGSELFSIRKKRSETGTTVKESSGQASIEYPAFVFDDEIATGGSMERAFDRIRSERIREIMAGAAHGIFWPSTDTQSGKVWNNGWDRVLALKPTAVIVSDSVASELPTKIPDGTRVYILPIAPLVAMAIKRNVLGRSMEGALGSVDYWRKWYDEHPNHPLFLSLEEWRRRVSKHGSVVCFDCSQGAA